MAGKFSKKVKYQKKYFNIYRKIVRKPNYFPEKFDKKFKTLPDDPKMKTKPERKSNFAKLFDLLDLWD